MDLFLDTCKIDLNLPPPVLLLGNKMDLPGGQVSPEEVAKWKQKNRVTMYYNVSAKEGTNVQESLNAFIQSLVSPDRYEAAPIQVIIPEAPRSRDRCC
jgi:translation elongation factor EF-4